MKKIAVLFLCLLFVTLSFSVLADDEIPDIVGKKFPDFTMTNTEGGQVTLSDLLRNYDAVAINIFTSWCPPCRKEFPDMESVYQRMSDRIAIVALTDEAEDTLETIADYKAEMGLSFDMGLAAGTGVVDAITLDGYPTTLLLDKTGIVCMYQSGYFAAEEAFEQSMLAVMESSNGSVRPILRQVFVTTNKEDPVPGALVRFTGNNEYGEAVTDSEGYCCYLQYGTPEKMTVEVADAPGYDLSNAREITDLYSSVSVFDLQ
jgi:peroxiredoxin